MIRMGLAGAGIAWFVNWLSPVVEPQYWELLAVTPAGDVYVAGSGSSCEAAWIKLVFPVAVDHVGCVRQR